ncbi:YesL family protein [Evansella sp. AB-rgal1]|uniref:YesL family protein n=1 Tax=Evansella sp. AB-rgal1 TaxID=3242696 RepID=UPI00359EC4D1
MNSNSWTGIMRIFDWIMRLAYVNILWILFTIVGLIIFGIFPATAAMFAVTRKWVRGQSEVPVFTTFWESYRKEFFKVNLLGLFIIIIGTVIYVDFLFLATVDGWIATFLTTMLIFASILFVIILFNIFPLFVHYQLSIFKYLKFSIILGVSKPHITLAMVFSALLLYFFILAFPGISIFFSGSVLAFAIMWLTNGAIQKIEAQGNQNE